jgi:C-terminal AAA-associated domain
MCTLVVTHRNQFCDIPRVSAAFYRSRGSIHNILGEREDHRAPREKFELELEDHLNRVDAENSLRAVIGWGRNAELFELCR